MVHSVIIQNIKKNKLELHRSKKLNLFKGLKYVKQYETVYRYILYIYTYMYTCVCIYIIIKMWKEIIN